MEPNITESSIRFRTNKTTEAYNKFNKILYLCGLPHFWVEDANFPEEFTRVYNIILRVLEVILGVLALSIFFTLFVMTSNGQLSRNNVGLLMVPTTYSCYMLMVYHRKGIKEILINLAITLKNIHNDSEVEVKMIKNVKTYTYLYFIGGAIGLASRGVVMLWKHLRGEPVSTLITTWPDVNDTSRVADVMRIVIYVLWWMIMFRIVGSHFLLFMILIGLSHQFKNLRCYFLSLNNIFKKNYLSQKEKEDKYEKALKTGIKAHITTLWCTGQCQYLCGGILNNQTLLITEILIPLLYNAMNPYGSSPESIAPIVFNVPPALFIWFNAAKITVESLNLSDAMYSSGWENCNGKTNTRIRKLIVIAMTRAQRPVILRGCYFIQLTYEAFWNLFRTAFSLSFILSLLSL